MRKRALDMAIQLVFIIIVMLVIVVIALRMFSQQASKVGTIANTEIQQAVSTCSEVCNSPVEFCQRYVAIGRGFTELTSGYYVCADSVPCSVVMQQYGRDTACSYKGYSLTPVYCMQIMCKYYIFDLNFDPDKATKEVFGQYSNIEFGENSISISFSNPSKILNPGPQRSCGGRIPTWIENQIFKAIKNVLNYYSTTKCDGVEFNIVIDDETRSLNVEASGECKELGFTGDVNILPLCDVLTHIPEHILNSYSGGAKRTS